VPAEFQRTRGDGVWRNAAAGAAEHVYGRLETYVDPAIEALNGGIGGFNTVVGTDIGTLPAASRWVAETAQEHLGVPDPALTQAITPGENAARLGGSAAAYLAELLITRGRGLPGFPPGPNGPGPQAPPPPGPTGPRLPGPPLPGPGSPRLPRLPGTVFDDVRDFGKIGLDLIGELRDAFSAPPQPPRSLNEAGDRLTGGIAPPDFGALQDDTSIRNRTASLTGGRQQEMRRAGVRALLTRATRGKADVFNIWGARPISFPAPVPRSSRACAVKARSEEMVRYCEGTRMGLSFWLQTATGFLSIRP
jgi:hypothetical protein